MATRATLEKLVEAGLVEAQGAGRGRSYISAKVYKKTGQKAAYVRQAGFDPIQQQMVLTYIDKHSSIKRADVMELCQMTKDQAYKLLNRLKNSDQITQIGNREGAAYERKRKYMRPFMLSAHIWSIGPTDMCKEVYTRVCSVYYQDLPV